MLNIQFPPMDPFGVLGELMIFMVPNWSEWLVPIVMRKLDLSNWLVAPTSHVRAVFPTSHVSGAFSLCHGNGPMSSWFWKVNYTP